MHPRPSIACAAALCSLLACAPSHDGNATVTAAESARPIDDARRRTVYRRAEHVAAAGELLGPREGTTLAADDPAFALAPLLVQELDPDGETVRPGRLRRDEDGGTTVQAGEPTVYHVTSTTRLDGRDLSQHVYLWWYPAQVDAPPTARGVRMTLGDDGFPFVWEALGDSAGVRPLFVAADLDAAATASRGDPLPGRAFAVERAVAERPEVVVAGLLEPGPVPLGPFVYLTPERDIAALICRCMPSRVERIEANLLYDLEPLDPAWLAGLPAGARPELAPSRLDALLRLP
jgi:hypothetical protein